MTKGRQIYILTETETKTGSTLNKKIVKAKAHRWARSTISGWAAAVRPKKLKYLANIAHAIAAFGFKLLVEIQQLLHALQEDKDVNRWIKLSKTDN